MKRFTRSVGQNGAQLIGLLLSADPAPPGELPAVVVFPGGGYMTLSDGEAEPVALAYLANGFHAFVLRYSVGTEATFAQALDDADAALADIRAHAAEWGIAPNRIALIGFSAGGHLAASLSTTGAHRPDALLLGYAITQEITLAAKPPYPPVTPHVDGDTPQTFLFSTAEDTVVPVSHSLAFAAALDRVGVSYELHIFQQGPHGLALGTPFEPDIKSSEVAEAFGAWFGLSLRWLRLLWG